MASARKKVLLDDDEFPFMKTTWYRFAFKQNAGWTINTILAVALFASYGIEPLMKYGYSDSNLDENGKIVSGPSGSGIVLVSGGLFLVSMTLYSKAFFDFVSDPKNFVAPVRKPKVVASH